MTRVFLAFALACFIPLNLARAAETQQPESARHIGVLLVARSPEDREWQAFRQGLSDAGYSEGRNLIVEWRFSGGDYARAPELVADLLQRKIEVLVVDTTLTTQAAKRATSTIPIVMTSIADPVGSGLVASLAHPGGNVTGLSIMTPELAGQRLQLLKDIVPQLSRVAILRNPDAPYTRKVIDELRVAAPSLSIELSVVNARTSKDFRAAFSAISRSHAQALYIIEDSVFTAHRTALLELTSQTRLPAMYAQREMVKAGGLMSYGPDFGDLFRRSAGYVDKILKGARAGDLPIEQPTKFEFIVNLKAARALGITLPEAILLRADEVIR